MNGRHASTAFRGIAVLNVIELSASALYVNLTIPKWKDHNIGACTEIFLWTTAECAGAIATVAPRISRMICPPQHTVFARLTLWQPQRCVIQTRCATGQIIVGSAIGQHYVLEAFLRFMAVILV